MKARNIIVIIILVYAVGLLFSPGSASAQEKQDKSLKEIVAEIRQEQGLGPDQQIDCSKVTDQQFEELGEAWMDVAIADPQRHEMMDRMMGGEGSQSLAIAHRRMGAQYLGCIEGGSYGNWMYPGNMGAGGLGGMMYGYGYGHDGWMHSWGGGIVMWIVFILVIGVIIYLILAPTGVRQVRSQGGTSESAQEILKKRYARGEISKEDYERMKKDIS